jgi:hypothetical protein
MALRNGLYLTPFGQLMFEDFSFGRALRFLECLVHL